MPASTPAAGRPSTARSALAFAAVLGAFAASVYLLIAMDAGDTQIAGCGGGGCEKAWSSKWAYLFGVPVTALGAALYGALAVLLLLPSRQVAGGLTMLAVAAGLAALYFLAVLALKLKTLCPWCCAVHALGLIAAAAILLRRPRPQLAWALGGAALCGIFIGVQALDPGHATHRRVEQPGEAVTVQQTTSPTEVMISLPDGSQINAAAFPHKGDFSGPMIVELFDYTCASCRDMHLDLTSFWEQLPGEPTLVYLPCPLERACHPDLPSSIEDHPNACALARLSLLLWRLDPERHPNFHHYLFTRKPKPEQAVAWIERMLGRPLSPEERNDPALDQHLETSIILFAYSGETKMPQLFLPDQSKIVGIPKTREACEKMIRAALKPD